MNSSKIMTYLKENVFSAKDEDVPIFAAETKKVEELRRTYEIFSELSSNETDPNHFMKFGEAAWHIKTQLGSIFIKKLLHQRYKHISFTLIIFC